MATSNDFFIKLLLSLVTSTICVTGDFVTVSDSVVTSQLTRAFVDNLTHGAIGFFSALIVVNEFHDQITSPNRLMLVTTCAMMSSLIDVDHFLAARSFSLKDATSLINRPIFHCTTIPLILFLLLVYSVRKNEHLTLNLLLAMWICAFLTHHLRDATRRGLWIWPAAQNSGLAKPVPYPLYILSVILVPYLLNFVISFGRYKDYRKLEKNQLEITIV